MFLLYYLLRRVSQYQRLYQEKIAFTDGGPSDRVAFPGNFNLLSDRRHSAPPKPFREGSILSEILDDDEETSIKRHDAAEADDDTADKRNKLLVEIWKQAVDTQKHFNDMCVKSRQLGLTFVAASLGAALYLFIRSTPSGGDAEGAVTHSISAYSFSVCGHPIVLHVSLAIIIAAAAAVYAVKRLDLGVYHQMLRGAVTFGEDLEEKHIRNIVGLQKGMTQAISHFSRHSDASAKPGSDGCYNYSGDDRRNAGEKLKGFYNFIFGLLSLLAILVFVASNFLKAVG